MRHQNRKILSSIIIALLFFLFSLNFVAYAQEGTLKWVFSDCGGSPAIGADGTIYCDGDGLVAVNPDGTQKWVFSDCGGSPAIGADGTIYCKGDGLVAVYPDGTQKWVFPGVGGQHVIGADGTIYATDSYSFYAINPDGTQKWSVKLADDSNYCSGDPIDLRGAAGIGKDGTIYVKALWECNVGRISYDFGIIAIDPDGTKKWTFGRGIEALAIGEDGTIYKTGYTQGCYSNFTAINPDGGLKWTEETDCFDHGFEDIVIGADGTIYVGIRMTNILPCEMGAEEIRSVNLVAYNQDGTVKWESGAGGGSPAIGADGIIYTSAVRFLPNEGDFKIVYSIDAVNPDGTQKWAYEIDHVDFDSDNCPDYWLIIDNFAIGVDGTLYVSSQHEDGNYKNLYAINTSSLGLANSSWPMFMHDERHTGRSDMQIINDFLTFDPDPSTYLFTPDTTDCQAGAVGKFSFEAKLTNISEKELSYLHVEVNELTNDNLLLTDNGLIGGGERFEVSKIDDYADGYLSAGEYVDVPFTVCLKNTKPFRFFVNVVGVAED